MSKTILAFGDSLTAGYLARGTRFSPYTNRLNELVDRSKFTIFNSGVSGETTRSMALRMPILLKLLDKPLDLAIILGGTNDLGSTLTAAKIAANLQKIHCAVWKTGAKTIAVSIPEMRAEERYGWITKKRNDANLLMLDFVKQHADHVSYFDLAAAIPCVGISSELRQQYWDDDLHFSEYGYKRFGELLHEHMKADGLRPVRLD
jgi:lysophospholipase L1-like esterase